MSQKDTAAILRAYIIDHFPTARRRNLGDSDPLLQVGIIDSMGILDLVTHIEATFGIVIVDDDLLPENFQNIEAIALFIEGEQKRNQRSLTT